MITSPSNIADIVKQAAQDVLNGKLKGNGRNDKGAWDKAKIDGLRGVPVGVIAIYDLNTTGYLLDENGGKNLLPFVVDEDDTGLSSLLKAAEHLGEKVSVGGILESADSGTYVLQVKKASLYNITLPP